MKYSIILLSINQLYFIYDKLYIFFYKFFFKKNILFLFYLTLKIIFFNFLICNLKKKKINIKKDFMDT